MTAVARPVHAIECPASMAMLNKTARALKVLHGPGCQMVELYPDADDLGSKWLVFFTAGAMCHCSPCQDRLLTVVYGPHTPGPHPPEPDA